MSNTPKFPLSLPGGMLIPYMDSRARQQTTATVFEMLGGVDRLYHEANRDRESYWDFVKLWGKSIPRAVATETTGQSDKVEEMLKRLDAAENAKVINGTTSRVSDDVVDVPVEDN